MHVILAKTFWEKTKGLLGENKPYPLLLHTRFGIHTFGMRYPIDVLVLDNTSRVRKLKKNLDPNRIFLWNPKYMKILELPQGTIEKEKIKLGEKILANF